jgi:hypothetical protein
MGGAQIKRASPLREVSQFFRGDYSVRPFVVDVTVEHHLQ